jgi:hypothetical protein
MAGNRRIRTPQPEGPDVLRCLQLVDYGLQIAHATKAEPILALAALVA